MRAAEDTTVMVTGATDGLGRAVAAELAGRGASLILHGRRPEALAEVVDELRAASGNDRIRGVLADFADLGQVARLADEVAATTSALHVLVNNAGIGAGEPGDAGRHTSADGHELRLAVNHLAGLKLTLRLLPLLRASAPARVVFVASLGQAPMALDDPQLERGYSGPRAYGQSKLAQITCGLELAERVREDAITVTSLHPGTYMPTKMVLAGGLEPVDSLETGVRSTVRLALDPELDGVTGRFFDRTRPATPDGQALDAGERRRVWDLSLALIGEPGP